MHRICRILFICLLLAIASTRATEASTQSHPMTSPASADAFWKKVVTFLNKNGGYATKEQFARAFGIHFGIVEPEHTVLTHEIDVITYQARSGVDWYFNARFQEYTKAWDMPRDPTISGVHIEWAIHWRQDSFGDPLRGQCITAAKAERDLVATGWETPWPQWNLPINAIPPVGNLGRKRDSGTERWGELPFGRVFPADAAPNSCVTGISMAAKTSTH